MRARFTFLLAALPFWIAAQNCGQVILNDDFSSSSGWTTQGNGDVNISNSVVNINAAAGDYNRVYKNLGQNISDNYWKSECDLNIVSPNSSGHGVGAIALALTAGNLDFMSYNSSQSYQETNQDGIAVILTSSSQTDNNINNWFFLIESKRGNVRQYDLNTAIYANSAVSNYYITLERISASVSQMSIYTDAARTTHIAGSPVTFNIDPLITGLNTIQHGIGTSSNPVRMLNATIDNSMVCQASASACANVIITDNFSNPLNWTSQGSGDVYVGNGYCNFNNAASGSYNRVFQPLTQTLSNNYWKAECDMTLLGQNQSGNGTGAIVMALTAGTLDFMSYDASQSYQETNQDGIAVVLTSMSATDNNINNWFFLIESKNGNNRSYDINTAIYASSSISSYYISLERTASGMTQLSVYSDSLHTSHIPGSPVQYAIDPLISGLNVVQHGSGTSGTASRVINARLDNLFVCQDEGVNVEEISLSSASDLEVYPNPTNTILSINSQSLQMQSSHYVIYNNVGQIVLGGILSTGSSVDVSQLAPASYFILVYNEEFVSRARFVKQ